MADSSTCAIHNALELTPADIVLLERIANAYGYVGVCEYGRGSALAEVRHATPYRVQRDRALKALAGGCRRFDGARSGWHALVTRCVGGWRVTRFDDDGPFGHCEALSQWDGVVDYLTDWGFTEPCSP